MDASRVRVAQWAGGALTPGRPARLLS